MSSVRAQNVHDEPLVIGLDCSTHGSKAIAWSLTGEVIAEGRVDFPLSNPQPGWYEQRAEDWLSASVKALTNLGSDATRRVRAIGITHQRETFVGVDSKGVPVRNAIVWMDERAFRQVDELRASVGEEAFHRITGKPLSMTPSVVKLAWIRQHEPEAFGRAHRWLDVQAYLLSALTAEDVTSVGSADPMGLVDLSRGVFSETILHAVGLTPQSVPRLLPSGSVSGVLLPEVAKRTQLPHQTPVVATAGDGQVAAMAAQILSLDRAYMNLGTAIVSGTVSREYMVDRAFRTMSGALPNTFLLESDLKGGTFTVDWLCQRLLGDRVQPNDLEKEAATLPAGSNGLVLVPYLATVMDPYWDDNASGMIVGLRGEHGPAHVFRAILEGIALEQRLHLAEIERVTRVPIREVRVLGGGAKSALWCQILADALGRHVQRTRSAEATSLGAAMLAATAVGLFSSAREAAEAMGGVAESFEPGEQANVYTRLFDEVYVEIYPALRGVLQRLAGLARG